MGKWPSGVGGRGEVAGAWEGAEWAAAAGVGAGGVSQSAAAEAGAAVAGRGVACGVVWGVCVSSQLKVRLFPVMVGVTPAILRSRASCGGALVLVVVVGGSGAWA